ncbi:hypothetical protein HYS29_02560 [Candidatus Microgenomates bacterium]|nr:hypothetical protein [Candidatus Microgenomates bacterium]
MVRVLSELFRRGGPEDSNRRLLEATVDVQVDRLVTLGLAGELGQTERVYRGSFQLPRGDLRPKGSETYFTIPLVVDPRVDWRTQCRLAGILAPLDEPVETTSPPDTPYLAWIQDPTRSYGYTFEEAAERMIQGEVGCLLLEVISLFHHKRTEHFTNAGVASLGAKFDEEHYLDESERGPNGEDKIVIPLIPVLYRNPLLGPEIYLLNRNRNTIGNNPLGKLSRAQQVVLLGKAA